MSFRMSRLTGGLALAGCTGLAQAAGFALIEQNASGLGNAYAGQAAAANDASTIFFNPAGMTRLPDRQLVLAGHLIEVDAHFSGTSTIGGGNGGDAGGLGFVPNAYYAVRLTPDVHVGVGLNAPFGLKTEYDSTWAGRTQAIKSELKTVNLNPAIAWRATEGLSLGAGVSLQYIDATLTSASAAGLATIKGDDHAWGYNLGLLWQASEGTRVGLAYRSKMDYTLEGDVTFSGLPALNGPVTAAAHLPDTASLSLLHQIDERWEVLADVTWTGWSRFDELRVLRTSGAVVSLTPEHWNDTYRYSLGASYRFDDNLKLRAGVAFDETPVSDGFRTARIPDEDRTWIAFGAQYRVSPKAVFDVGYAHLLVDHAAINKTESGVTLTGEYRGAVDILSAQLTLDF